MAKLGDYADFIMGQAPASSECNADGRGTPFVKAGQFGISTPVVDEWTTNPLKMADDKDVLICVVGATSGKLNRGIKCAIGRSVAAIRPHENVVRDYIYYGLHPWIQRLRGGSQGSAIGVITKDMLDSVDMAFPTTEKQEEIVQTFSLLEDIIGKRKREIEKMDQLIKARFGELFSQGKHKLVKASEVCDFITKGTTPPTGEIIEEYGEGMIPFLKVYNLSFTGELLFDDNPQYIPKETHNGKLARSKVYPNDVLMNIVGPPLGKFTIVTDEYEEWNINQAIAIFRAKERILPRFLLHALMQPTVLEPFIGQAVGIRQQNLSLEQCRNLQFPLPSIGEQQAFVKFAEQIDKSKVKVENALNEVQLLFDSLMQEYFG